MTDYLRTFIQLKPLLRKFIPNWALKTRQKHILTGMRNAFAKMTRREAFSRVYTDRLWGEDPSARFFSGSGSVGIVAETYQQFVLRFISERGIRSMVDLGCGDFRVARPIAESVETYIGIDIVPEVIDELKSTYRNAKYKFASMDIVDEDLPAAELCCIRQVLQHLSNDEISKVLGKLTQYQYVLITEHYPAPNKLSLPNINKPHGPDTRLVDGSAVFLDEPPFNLERLREVLCVPVMEGQVESGETIRTFLLESPSSTRESL